MSKSSLLIVIISLIHLLWGTRGDGWSHGWDTLSEAQFIDFGYKMLSPAQAEFVATHYKIVSIEKCTGNSAGLKTEAATYEMVKLLKSFNPNLKVLFYINTDMVSLNCYESYGTLLSNPSWWLRNSTGAILNTSSDPFIPYVDFRNEAARRWFANIPNSGDLNHPKVDGVLVDSTGGRCPVGLAGENCSAWTAAAKWAVGNMTAIFKNFSVVNYTNNKSFSGEIICNGIQMYTLPGFPADNGVSWINEGWCSGAMAEHVAVFESVLPNGSLNVSKVVSLFNIIQTISKQKKFVVMATWPGLLISPAMKYGFFSWPGNSQPKTMAAWRSALLNNHSWAMALYLTVANEYVWMQYQGWYSLQNGAVPCELAPGQDLTRCASPSASQWYPGLTQPLGEPLGEYKRVGNIFVREFRYATSYLDLDKPWNSSVTFRKSIG